MCTQKASFASRDRFPQGWNKTLSSKVGPTPGFGSELDYNARGFRLPVVVQVDLQVSDIVSAFTFKYYNTQTRIAKKTPRAFRLALIMDLEVSPRGVLCRRPFGPSRHVIFSVWPL